MQLLLTGDVMIGRGIDQIQKHRSKPDLYEAYARSARQYIEIAEERNGPIPLHVAPEYIWGDALLEQQRYPNARSIINLETAITTAEGAWPGKGIHYRMHPRNVACLAAAGIDCCVLANNHVLDWGYAGLSETLAILDQAGIAHVGGGSSLEQAVAPAMVRDDLGKRALCFAFGMPNAGVSYTWAAEPDRAGVALLDDFSNARLEFVADAIRHYRQANDIVIVSLHWGGNWGYRVNEDEREFAHQLIDQAQVDVIFGHSSHHPRGIEVYRGRLILYGCGDLINDYEGISGHARYRPHLSVMYFVELNPNDGSLATLTMSPMEIKHFSLHRASAADVSWLGEMFNHEGKTLGTSVVDGEDRRLQLIW